MPQMSMILRVGIYWQSLPQNGENRKFDVCIAAKATPNIELSRLRSTIKVGVTGWAKLAAAEKAARIIQNAIIFFLFMILAFLWVFIL